MGRRHAAALVLALGAALLIPGAVAGKPTTSGDETPPVVTPVISGTLGTNGWYVTNVTVGWKVEEDPGSIILSTHGCDTTTFASDTTGTPPLTCTATSDGGTASVTTKTFKIDKTAPTVTATPDHPANANGWYRSAVSIVWSASDALSGVAGCDQASSYAGPDNAAASRSGSCTDKAGNSASTTFSLKYDSTAPSVTATPDRPPNANGWYRSTVSIAWSGSDTLSGLAGCDSDSSYSGPDSATASRTGSCTDKAGNVGSKTFALSYDATAPTVAATPDRPADANGWYRSAVSIAWSGSDALSGLAGCDPASSYGGPDNASASRSGNCTDKAGNVGSKTVPLSYDATPPTVSRLSSTAGNRRVDLTWVASADTQLVHVTRTKGSETKTIYSGKGRGFRDSRLKVGAKYHYTVTASDAAGNSASKTITVTATGALLSPVPGARIGSAPLLRWAPAKGARYYNIQLLRGRTILSAWPTSAHFKVPRSWVFHGRRYRLARGVYRWYVWPGFGRFSASRYGHLLGGSSFVFSG